jgi:molybdopterin synthase catalytic subunit
VVAAVTVLLATISDAPLQPDDVDALVRNATAGAVVTFTGRVRDHDGGRPVVALDYSAHPDAGSVLAEIAAEIAGDPEVVAVAVAHRVGSLAIGDAAIVASVSCAHRKEAFGVCERIVDEVKHRLPVWKRQVFDDGTHEWVGSC